jgi:enamine deaminase RidA (YjgF/YER057c/UK114 family)
MTTLNLTEQGLKVSCFASLTGAEEYCIIGIAPESLPLEEALNELASSYEATLLDKGLDASTQQFVRIILSDIANEQEQLYASDLYRMVRHGACSIIEQSPLEGGQAAIFAYHIKSPEGGFRLEGGAPKKGESVCLRGRNYSLVWSPGFTCGSAVGSEDQTKVILSSLDASLASRGLSVAKNTIRTWIYVRDIDNNYAGMVKARREYFETIGLTKRTRYIASTGIEGKCGDKGALVTLDALSVGGIREEQLVRMEAPRNMSSTIVYGVTFERGTRVRFGDRSHLYISGTASIDKLGATIYTCDIRKQVERTFDNVAALLAPQGATLDNLLYLTLYLRNPKHYPFIQDILAERLPETVPLLAVYAPVCRPEWLFEVDGVAVIPDKNGFPAFI